jgi:A/G-specific adenine glycosylase
MQHSSVEKRQIQQALLAWYAESARTLPWRSSRDPYAIWVSEVMLQQTRVTTVIPYYERFLEALPTVEALAASDEETLHRLWKGLGYYRRAALLKKGAQVVVNEFGGRMPENLDALRSIPGLGAYTAGAVASIAFGLPVSAVDGNVIRVFSRLLNDETPVDKLRERLQKGEADAWVAAEDPGAWTQAVMELGATVCTPKKPGCVRCPVQGQCRAFAAKTVEQLPVKGKEVKHTESAIQVGVFRKAETVWIEKRPAEGLLAGLWGFPLLEKMPRVKGREVLRYKHVFTHRTWNAAVFEFKGQPPKSSSGKWVSLAALSEEAIPTAFQPVVRWLVSRDLFSL